MTCGPNGECLGPWNGLVFLEAAKREGRPVSQECLGWCRLSLERVKYPNRKIHTVVGNKGLMLQLFVRNGVTFLVEE